MHILLLYLALYRHHKWMLTLGVILTISTLLAGVSLLTLSGWLISATAIAGRDGLYNFNYILPAVLVRGTAIVRIAGRYFERLVSHDATFRILQHLRVFIFSRLIPLSPAGLTHFHQGELLNRVVADINTLNHLYLNIISPLTGTFVVIVVMIIGLSILDLTLAVALGSLLLLTLFLLPSLLYCASKQSGKNLILLRGKYRHQLTIWLQNQAELIIFGANKHYRAQMDNTELDWHKTQLKLSKLTALSQAIIILINGIAIITILWITSNNIENNSQSNTLITLFIFCALASFEILTLVSGIFQHLSQVISAASRITKLIEFTPKVQFTEKCTVVPIHVSLHLQNVTFSYNGQLQPALNNLTLDISAGEHIAIIGNTGCGKSTLLQLLTRAWDPCQGLISINSIPIINFSEPILRRTISMVTQRVHLFSATLRDNLLLASPDAQDTHLISILEQVGLQKLIEGEGLNSWLGEGGRLLSSGELRRLAIARAILHDAPLMLLDEPTEGLDVAAESEVLNLLKQTMKNKTALMVTHRLQGLTYFNRIVVMENGQIIEQGNHTELLRKHGIYYQLKRRL